MRTINLGRISLQVMDDWCQVSYSFPSSGCSVNKSIHLYDYIPRLKETNMTRTNTIIDIIRLWTKGYTSRPERITGIDWACTCVGASKPILSVQLDTTNEPLMYRVKLIKHKEIRQRQKDRTFELVGEFGI